VIDVPTEYVGWRRRTPRTVVTGRELFAAGEAPPYVMAQLGDTSAELTLALYARQMDRRDGEPERLRVLVEDHDWAARRQGKGGETAESAAENATLVERNGQNSPDLQAFRSIKRP
jgi:hypothetical protein